MRLFLTLLSVFHFIVPSLAAMENPQDRHNSQNHQILQQLEIGGSVCGERDKYLIYLIDNFDQSIEILPELVVSHGELMRAFLVSGRSDIEVRSLNTDLGSGLAKVLELIMSGECVDGVVSSVPGSNYSYSQVSSLIQDDVFLKAENILEYRKSLLQCLLDIAISGFPSVEWLVNLDANPIKLREDARKIFFIEKLGRLGVPILLPYGNIDSLYKGEERNINLLSLTSYARAYNGVSRDGKPLTGYPNSPLSAGGEKAVYEVVECPEHDDSMVVRIDVNNDGHVDFIQERTGPIPYYDPEGNLAFSPPPMTQEGFLEFLESGGEAGTFPPGGEVVLTKKQFLALKENCTACQTDSMEADVSEFIWLNSARYEKPYPITAQCAKRGVISGTSLIPPAKIKEFLPTLYF